MISYYVNLQIEDNSILYIKYTVRADSVKRAKEGGLKLAREQYPPWKGYWKYTIKSVVKSPVQ